ncbi:hypothetical protein ACWEQL_23350 [Kitasatospora sp. NPDC004240]
MNHNDVARRTAFEMPARSLTPRTLAVDSGAAEAFGPGRRELARTLPSRVLTRTSEGGR